MRDDVELLQLLIVPLPAYALVVLVLAACFLKRRQHLAGALCALLALAGAWFNLWTQQALFYDSTFERCQQFVERHADLVGAPAEQALARLGPPESGLLGRVTGREQWTYDPTPWYVVSWWTVGVSLHDGTVTAIRAGE